MSLINDALKKAQSEVDRGRMNPVPGTIAGVRPRTKRKGSFLVILAIILVVGGAGWAVAFFIAIPSKSSQSVPVVTPTIAPAELAQVPESPVVPVESAPVPVAEDKLTETVVNEPIVEPLESVVPAQETAQITVAEMPVKEVGTAVTLAEAAPATQTAPATPPALEALALNNEVVFKLKHLEITAVMGEGKNARIMTGGQVYKAGELINLELKIRFVGKKGPTLFFTDQHDLVYEKAL